jgi:hypothetical protein
MQRGTMLILGYASTKGLKTLVFEYLRKAERRQTDKQTNRQTDKQTNRQTDKQTNRQTDKQTNRETDKQKNRQTDKQTNRQTDKQQMIKIGTYEKQKAGVIPRVANPFPA